MKVDLRKSKDFLAGLLFILIGGLAVIIARKYPMGSAMRMGPGYFPTILGSLLCLFGAYLAMRGVLKTPRRSAPMLPADERTRPPRRFTRPFRGEERRVEGEWGWKPLALISFAIVLFGFVVSRLGLVPALVVMFFVSALAGREFRLKEVLLLIVLMTAFAIGVFVYGLKLPFQLVAGF
jgi:hypothetical protein